MLIGMSVEMSCCEEPYFALIYVYTCIRDIMYHVSCIMYQIALCVHNDVLNLNITLHTEHFQAAAAGQRPDAHIDAHDYQQQR
jgi:hypothetical protein